MCRSVWFEKNRLHWSKDCKFIWRKSNISPAQFQMLWRPESTFLHLNILHHYAKVNCYSKELLEMHSLFWLQKDVQCEFGINYFSGFVSERKITLQMSTNTPHKWVSCELLKDKHRGKKCVSLSRVLSPPRWLFTLGFITILHLSEQFEPSKTGEQLSFPFSWL